MAVEPQDNQNKVIIDPRDLTKVIVEEQPVKVEIAVGGPQGARGPAGTAGPAGADGAQGPQGEKGSYTVSATEPANPNVGDAWFNSTTAQMYLRYDGFWVETSTSYVGPQGIPGVAGVQNIDGGSANKIYSYNQLISGGSASSTYTQNQRINGGMAGSF